MAKNVVKAAQAHAGLCFSTEKQQVAWLEGLVRLLAQELPAQREVWSQVVRALGEVVDQLRTLREGLRLDTFKVKVDREGG